MDHKVSIVSKDLSVYRMGYINISLQKVYKSAFLMRFVVVIVVCTHLSMEEILGCMVTVECQERSQICRSSKWFS